jgi:hypothetical protein
MDHLEAQRLNRRIDGVFGDGLALTTVVSKIIGAGGCR